MTVQRTGLDYGLIGALADIGFAIVLGSFLAINTNWQGDAAPRPLVIAVLFATPGVIALIGVLAERPWLLIAGSLPLFPAAGLSFTGATLVFLVPATLMVVGAMRMVSLPEVPRTTLANGLGAAAITFLILLAGWTVLIGLTTSACYPVSGGQACGSSGFISTNGLLVAGVCLATAVAIAVLSVTIPRWRSRRNAS